MMVFSILLFLTLPALARPVTLDYTNADLVPVLKRLARDAGLNIFISPEVKGRVTVKVKDTTPEAALKLILSLQEEKYAYKLLKNTMVVATPEKLQQIPDDLFGR